MSFPRYPAYKDSGVEWLGEVPAHWDLLPLKRRIARIESGTSVNAVDTPASEGEYGVLKTSCVYSGEFRPDENKAVLPEEYERVACPLLAGTLIVSRMNTPDLVGAAGLVREAREGIFLPDRLWQIQLSALDPSFVHRWTQSDLYRAQVQMACSGTSASMQNLAQDQFGSFLLPTPPAAEQHAISIFLDREIAKIDALIAEQERLIELLKEKRQAVISHAVTKGLDPDVPMKDSGVEWLGEVPAHWEVLRAKHLAIELTSGPRGWSDNIGEEGALFIQSGNLTDKLQIDITTANRVLVPDDSEASRSRLQADDVVVCITGAKTGNVARFGGAGEEAYINQHLCLVRARPTVLPAYLAVVLKSRVGQTHFSVSQYGLKQGLALQDVGETPIPLPPYPEQHAVVAFLNHAVTDIETLLERSIDAIELLKERRSALVSAAVTGQIDVRGQVDAEAA